MKTRDKFQNKCSVCQNSFNQTTMKANLHKECNHLICQSCTLQKDKAFTCPIDGIISYSIQEMEPAKDVEELMTLIEPKNNLLSQIFKPNDQDLPTDSSQMNNGNLLNDLSNELNQLNDPDNSLTLTDKITVQRHDKQPRRKCEAHPDYEADIVCRNITCEKYVCYECIGFGDHSVR